MLKQSSAESVAEGYLELLVSRGVEYFFGNAGTDFAPIVEALAKRHTLGQPIPRPITVPHEIPAVAMAHGYAMVTGRPQVVMVHVTVGTAHGLAGIMNAARSQVPMLFTAGRTPLTEGRLIGARDLHIHWAQEAFDQAAIAREFVKWDYELRMAEQLEVVVDRALAITQSAPAGPVYLTLPREVLAGRLEHFEYSHHPRQGAARLGAAPASLVDEAARALASARHPLFIVKAAGRDPGAVAALVSLAERLAVPVVEHFPTYLNFPHDHALHAGYDPHPYLDEADVVVVIESDVPWIPRRKNPRPEASVIQIGQDPLFARYPIRGFPSDLTLVGSPRLTLDALRSAVGAIAVDGTAVESRRARWTQEHQRLRAGWAAQASGAQNDSPIDMAWVSRCVGALVDEGTVVVNEYDLQLAQTCFRTPGTFFGSPSASGLGWGLGAALGAKLASPDKTVVCCVGDGAYMFGCPTAAHFVGRAYDLPVLFVVFNNRAWNAVSGSVKSFAPEGWAVKSGTMPLAALDPSPDYELVCQSSGGYGERVEDPRELPAAFRRALRAVREERRQALLNVICRKP
ncbi:MAG: thiamine pyrophosphate-requiring protein [Candidatus Rokubacteria bacterium]|nr:thiamine pyrophosphate-requiring protein [Candidatus Rokubacteria bacterium]